MQQNPTRSSAQGLPSSVLMAASRPPAAASSSALSESAPASSSAVGAGGSSLAAAPAASGKGRGRPRGTRDYVLPDEMSDLRMVFMRLEKTIALYDKCAKLQKAHAPQATTALLIGSSAKSRTTFTTGTGPWGVTPPSPGRCHLLLGGVQPPPRQGVTCSWGGQTPSPRECSGFKCIPPLKAIPCVSWLLAERRAKP